MLGLLITLVFSVAMVGWGRFMLGSRLAHLHPAANAGVAGLIGLGSVGLLTLPIGLLPSGLKWGLWIVALIAVVGAIHLFRNPVRVIGRRPEGLEWVAVAAFLLPLMVGIVGALAPSTALDWDTIAYHLAVPKMWLAEGQIHPVSFIHHSNFPFTVDNLYLWGLVWGGQAGAKAFTISFTLLGTLALFGLGRQAWGPRAGLIAAAAFMTAPVVVWETGTGYLDVAHGLYAGLGAWMLLRSLTHDEPWLPGALLMGFALGTKYTGLQSAIAVLLVATFLVIRHAERGRALRTMGVATLVVLAIGGSWYAKNVAWTGNPVYPFFYERFGGENWDQKQADVYRNEQKTFGVPIDGPFSIPHAVLGLAYQHGRYINPGQRLEVHPDGRASGATGNPLGAIGFPIMLGLFAGALGSRRKEFAPAMAWVAICLLMWALMSQQSRYAVSFAPVLALALGAWATTPKRTTVVGIVLALQVMVTGLWAKEMLLDPQRIRVAFGAESQSEYLQQKLGFFEAARYMNANPPKGRVALYDEVFGFYLDIPYIWAGYGHTTEFGYAEMRDSEDLLAAYRRLGVSQVYMNLRMSDPAFVGRWARSAGLVDQGEPMSDEERSLLLGDVQARWKVLLADAALSGELRVKKAFRGGVLFKVTEQQLD